MRTEGNLMSAEPLSTHPTTPNRLYFAAWRWHFYAGLYVIPFLIMLAVTGLIMLWVSSVTELNGERTQVAPGATLMPLSALEAAAEAAVPGATATQYISPMGADRVAVFAVAKGEETTGVTLNPYTGEVVETFPWRAGWYDFATDIHGTLLIGDLGDWLIEAAASLGLLLTITGIYLHWPRNGATWGKALTIQRTKGRAFWKSLHGAVALWVSVILVIFLVSGLSWAGLLGGQVRAGLEHLPDREMGCGAPVGRNPCRDEPWGRKGGSLDPGTDAAAGIGLTGRNHGGCGSGQH
jgi:uncharacterized iron-regulated membrane protein